MDGWSKKLEDKILEMRMSEYEHRVQRQNNHLMKLKTKPYVLGLAISFVILLLVQMILLFVAFNSSLTFKSGNASLLWTYSASQMFDQAVYQLSTFGTALVIITCLLMINIVVFAFNWIKDPVFLSINDKKNKKLWITVLISSAIAFSVFLILDLIVISIFNNGSNYPQNLNSIKVNHQLGLTFTFVEKNNANLQPDDWVLKATPMAIFTSVMQLVSFLASIVWLLGFNFSIDMNKIFKKNKKS